MIIKKALPCVILLCAQSVMLSQAHGGERRFTYLYEATTSPKGSWEFEHWATWKTAKETNRDYDRFDFRYELEYGVTDNFQLGIYFSDWRYEENRPKGKHRGDWRDFAIEGILSLRNPNTDPIGVALYGEVKIGDELFELEGKLLFQKNMGPVVAVYNVTLEAEWEGSDYSDDKGKFEQALGVSYQFSPSFTAGIELVHEIGMPDWRGMRGKAVVYLGPNFSYRAPSWWATLTPLFQISDVEDEVDFQMRLIVGFELKG